MIRTTWLPLAALGAVAIFFAGCTEPTHSNHWQSVSNDESPPPPSDAAEPSGDGVYQVAARSSEAPRRHEVQRPVSPVSKDSNADENSTPAAGPGVEGSQRGAADPPAADRDPGESDGDKRPRTADTPASDEADAKERDRQQSQQNKEELQALADVQRELDEARAEIRETQQQRDKALFLLEYSQNMREFAKKYDRAENAQEKRFDLLKSVYDEYNSLSETLKQLDPQEGSDWEETQSQIEKHWQELEQAYAALREFDKSLAQSSQDNSESSGSDLTSGSENNDQSGRVQSASR